MTYRSCVGQTLNKTEFGICIRGICVSYAAIGLPWPT